MCDGGLRIAVRLTPGAKVDRIEAVDCDAEGKPCLRVRVRARPIGGQANQALIELLAKRWRLPKSAVAIVKGSTSRNKVVALQGDAKLLKAGIEAEI